MVTKFGFRHLPSFLPQKLQIPCRKPPNLLCNPFYESYNPYLELYNPLFGFCNSFNESKVVTRNPARSYTAKHNGDDGQKTKVDTGYYRLWFRAYILMPFGYLCGHVTRIFRQKTPERNKNTTRISFYYKYIVYLCSDINSNRHEDAEICDITHHILVEDNFHTCSCRQHYQQTKGHEAIGRSDKEERGQNT